MVYAKLFVVHKTVMKRLDKWKKRKQKHNKQRKKTRGSFYKIQLQGIVIRNKKKLDAKKNRGTYSE